MVHEIENFFGVYLLFCLNPKYKGRTYVGFTVDPNRRVKQHNMGSHKGGAQRTSGKGPWEMVLIVHGFPNMISALRFEWAWQNPDRSRRLRDLPRKRTKESAFQFKFRIVSEMLRTSPWKRLPLTIRWLKQDYQQEFSPDCSPPAHMPIVYGPVSVKKVGPAGNKETVQSSQDPDVLPPLTQGSRPRCAICSQKMTPNENTLKCVLPDCRMISHTACLARHFLTLDPREVLPVEGECPKCHTPLLWGDLIRYKMGCYRDMSQNQTLEAEPDGAGENDNHWTADLQEML